MFALRIWTCCHACRGVLTQAAIALDTRNPLARFELANVLMAQERLEEALQQLQELAVSAPVEVQTLASTLGVCLLLTGWAVAHMVATATTAADGPVSCTMGSKPQTLE
jgi:predicted Zn-dependent protease